MHRAPVIEARRAVDERELSGVDRGQRVLPVGEARGNDSDVRSPTYRRSILAPACERSLPVQVDAHRINSFKTRGGQEVAHQGALSRTTLWRSDNDDPVRASARHDDLSACELRREKSLGREKNTQKAKG